jgi:lysozyme
VSVSALSGALLRVAASSNLGNTYKTSAAGRYQFLVKTWDELKDKLNLVDFSPASQDAAAIELIRQRGALNDVKAGRIQSAIAKCAPIWASLPGAGYNQPERKLSSLLTAFNNSGGTVTA